MKASKFNQNSASPLRVGFVLVTLLFAMSTRPAVAQRSKVIRSEQATSALLSQRLWGVQVVSTLGGAVYAGWLCPVGVGVHMESPMKNRRDKAWVVRPELGIGSLVDMRGVFSIDALASVEFRNYYNLKRRLNVHKDIEGNSGNFFAARIYFRSPGLPLSPEPTEPKQTTPYGRSFGPSLPKNPMGIGIVPTWGIRRNLGRYINCEFGVGIGAEFLLLSPLPMPAAEMHLRVGYRFANKGRP